MTTPRSATPFYLRSRTVRVYPWSLVTPLLLLLVVLVGCNASPPPQKASDTIAKERVNYVPKNDVEGKNYNKRIELADDPTTILWCTIFPASPTAPMQTYAIVGKVTSGTKRPYSTTIGLVGGDGYIHYYDPEKPGPDGMFGPSAEYDYGFMPNGAYVDFRHIPQVCTTEPTVFHRQTIQTADAGLVDAQIKARAALAQGDEAGATRILDQALGAR